MGVNSLTDDRLKPICAVASTEGLDAIALAPGANLPRELTVAETG